MKRTLALAAALTLTLTAAAPSYAEPLVLDNDAMYAYMLDEFLQLAEVPRGSSHTEKATEYLTAWGIDHGFETVADEVGNVRIDVPATEGYEEAPLTILQAHMDMVAVSDDGRDMLVSPITVVVDEEKGIISSDGHTSLGADDGIGIVSAMFLATSQDYHHGPLRLIFTINEEGGSPSGTGNMDHAWVTDANYLINIDSEDYATCTVSACGFNSYSYNVPLVTEAVPEGYVAYAINLSGLMGGHSGVDIDLNRANAIKAVDYCMAFANYKGMNVQIASFTGGTGGTAIPSLASAVIVFAEEYAEEFEAEMAETIRLFAQQFDRTEAGYSFIVEKTDLPEQVLSLETSATVIDLVAALEDGVNTISQRYKGIVETSFNMGTINVAAGAESATIRESMRLSSRWPTMLANMQFSAIGRAFGVELVTRSEDPFNPANINVGWEEREGDTIARLYARCFKEYTGDDCVVTAVHGGLECADFAAWSDTIQIISVGPTVNFPHSTSEHVEIYTTYQTCGAIAQTLSCLAEGITE